MASDPPGSSPASPKSDSAQAHKEDAETTATRKELRNTYISDSNNDGPRSSTPEVSGEKVVSKDEVSSPKKKRAHDQVDDDPAATTGSLNVRVESNVEIFWPLWPCIKDSSLAVSRSSVLRTQSN